MSNGFSCGLKHIYICVFQYTFQGGLTALLPRGTDDARRLRLGGGTDMHAAPTAPTPTAAGGNAPDGAKVTERHSNLGPTDLQLG